MATSEKISHEDLETLLQELQDLREIETALRRSRNELRQTLEATTDGIWTWNFKSGKLFFSPKYYTMLGYEPDAFAATYENWTERLHPDDRSKALAVARKYLETKPDIYENEFRMRTREGGYLWIRARARVVERDASGQPVYMIGNHEDVTFQKEAEARIRESEQLFRLMAENATDMLSKHSEEGDYLFVSPSCQKLLGYRPDELIGRSAYAFFHPEDLDEIRKSHRTILDQTSDHTVSYRIRRKDGQYLWVETNSKMVRGQDRKNSGEIIAITRDISERKQAEMALRRSEGELHYLSSQLIQAQELERRRLSNELHDELGQALMVLKLQLRSVQKKVQSDPSDAMASIGESLAYIDEIANRVRQLSRELSPAVLDDLGLAAAIRKLVDEVTQHTDIHLKSRLEDIRGELSGDTEIALYRVFQEALTNVLKHAHATRITLKMERHGDCLSCLVEDNGGGFEAGPLPDGRSFPKGMGLTAMSERVRMAGGELDVSSRPGQGTRVAFHVPFTRGNG